jgi:hypothetical protein
MEDRIMSELAFNLNGDPFEVPPGAVGWRVRKMKSKGAPEVAYGRNGQPLVLPLEADIDDLRTEVTTPGRYRLDPVDDNHKPIEGAPVGYVYVHELASARPAESGGGSTAPTNITPLGSPSESVVIEAMRMNAEMARMLLGKFPDMMQSAAVLLRAADGAGLPAREPRFVVDDDGDDDDDADDEDDGVAATPAKGLDLLVQLLPLLMQAFAGAKVKMPDLAGVLDWRKAAPAPATSEAVQTPAITRKSSVTTDADVDTAVTIGDALPAIDPATMMHFIAIQSALTPNEAALARAVAADLGPAALRSWFEELKKLSVPQAVQKVRVLIAGNTEAGS